MLFTRVFTRIIRKLGFLGDFQPLKDINSENLSFEAEIKSELTLSEITTWSIEAQTLHSKS